MERVNTAPSSSYSIRLISFEPGEPERNNVKARKLHKAKDASVPNISKVKTHYTGVDTFDVRMPRCILKDGKYRIIKDADIYDIEKKKSMIELSNKMKDHEMDI